MKNLLLFCLATAFMLVSSCTNPAADQAAAPDDGSAAAMATVNSFFAAASSHDAAKLDEITQADFRSHHYPAPPGSDKVGFLQGMKDFFAAYPDVQVKVIDQFAKGDKVFSYFSWTGTHQGAFMGIPPTGKQVTVEGMDIWRVQDGKLAENWVIMDGLGLMIQLGAVPPPGGAQTATQ